MIKSSSFSKDLMRWYRHSARDLPWRRTSDPYKVWISEIMLQQTTVSAVVPYYEQWVKRFPNIQSVARASLQTILKSWQGLGYYSRARNIHKTAKIIREKFKGIFPQEAEILKNLPGFGAYTTGAVLSIAFDQRQPIIDANIRRVVMRQLKMDGKADAGQDKKALEFLLRVMPRKQNCIFNQAMMELGALICRSKNPSCLICPIRCTCAAYKHGLQDIIPKPKKYAVKSVHAAIAVIQDEKKYLIQKRPAGGLFADLWEFPGGKIARSESPRQALVREIKEEIGIDVQVLSPLPRVVHYYTQFKATLHVWLCRPLAIPREDKTRKWVSLKDIVKYPMPSGSAKIVEYLSRARVETHSYASLRDIP